MKQVSVVALSALLLAGCAGTPGHDRFIAPGKINEALTSWQGRDIDSAIPIFGPPERVNQAEGLTYYSWDAEGCDWWFSADSNTGKIRRGSANGQNGVCYYLLVRK